MKFFNNHPFLFDLGKPSNCTISQNARYLTFKRGDIVFEEGEDFLGLYLIK